LVPQEDFNVFPNMFPIAPHFVPYALPRVVLLGPIYSDLDIFTVGVNISILRSLESFRTMFLIGYSRRSLQKILNLEGSRHPHLINSIMITSLVGIIRKKRLLRVVVEGGATWNLVRRLLWCRIF
jgi:hypothetical protein